MKYFKGKTKPKKRLKTILLVFALTVVLGGCVVAGGVRYWYLSNLRPLTRQSSQVVVTIPTGYSIEQIGKLLQTKAVIKNATAFEWYIRSHKLGNQLQAGEYQLDAANNVKDIVIMLTGGKVKVGLFTILPGQRLDQIQTAFTKAGFSTTEVNAAFNPDIYANNPALVGKPKLASLEGYLYPESYQTNSTTTAQDIIKLALDQMAAALTPQNIDKFAAHGLNPYQAITLASIVEKEASGSADRRMVAQVFLNRLKINMALGSDVTYHYAAAITGQEPSATIDSPYNTRIHTGLPPGPISNVSKTSLDAVANPTPNDYLFFVAGDDGKIYYSKTAAEHEQLAKEHCKVLCSTY